MQQCRVQGDNVILTHTDWEHICTVPAHTLLNLVFTAEYLYETCNVM